ncbi:hypothetical protein ACH5RR_038654 [Cinchona calisaya]|uniref:Uncharacterized protein n=1 Tax=Cinchona calisaya TaxID=153742 RepID=A0ABD2XXQ9_9GENT
MPSYTCDRVICEILQHGLETDQNTLQKLAQYAQPMPWIGLYIAAASLTCFLAVAADTFHGFRHKKLWFPTKFSALNAASLTVLGAALKLPEDLGNPMPGGSDQLTKLSGIVLLCTSMFMFFPSLGQLNDKEILTNLAALSILVITTFVNICIQLGTGVIYTLKLEHTFFLVLLMFLVMLMCFSAIAIPTTKAYIQLKYSEAHNLTSCESEGRRKITAEALKDALTRYWLMAETGDPQFLIARSVTCFASGAICFSLAIILTEAAVRTYLNNDRLIEGNGSYTDYSYTIYVILAFQVLGVMAATFVSVSRCLATITFPWLGEGNDRCWYSFKIENYWIQRLEEWKGNPLSIQVRGWKRKKFAQRAKTLALKICIAIQRAIIVISKSLQTFFVLCASFISPLSCCKRLLNPSLAASNNQDGSVPESGSVPDLCSYILLLEDEPKLPDRVLENISSSLNQFIMIGKRKQVVNLAQLLLKSSDLKGLVEFDKDHIPGLNAKEPDFAHSHTSKHCHCASQHRIWRCCSIATLREGMSLCMQA